MDTDKYTTLISEYTKSIPPTIMFRMDYGPSTKNLSKPEENKNCDHLPSKEELYNYLRIDTNPGICRSNKIRPKPDKSYRRSLRLLLHSPGDSNKPNKPEKARKQGTKIEKEKNKIKQNEVAAVTPSISTNSINESKSICSIIVKQTYCENDQVSESKLNAYEKEYKCTYLSNNEPTKINKDLDVNTIDGPLTDPPVEHLPNESIVDIKSSDLPHDPCVNNLIEVQSKCDEKNEKKRKSISFINSELANSPKLVIKLYDAQRQNGSLINVTKQTDNIPVDLKKSSSATNRKRLLKPFKRIFYKVTRRTRPLRCNSKVPNHSLRDKSTRRKQFRASGSTESEKVQPNVGVEQNTPKIDQEIITIPISEPVKELPVSMEPDTTVNQSKLNELYSETTIKTKSLFSPIQSSNQKKSIGSTEHFNDDMTQLSSTKRSCTNKPIFDNLMHNPLNSYDGVVLVALYTDRKIVVVQEKKISYWKYPKHMSQLFDLTPEWKLIGEINRITIDIEIVSPYQYRLCYHDGEPVYIEMRTKLMRSREMRECDLISVYINVYYEDRTSRQCLDIQSVHLDTICGSANNVCYTSLPNSRYFVMAWTEQAANKTRCGLCKYSLTPSLDTLASIREFSHVNHSVNWLTCLGDDKLIGLGYSVVTMWNHQTLDLLMNIDMDLPIGRNLGSFLCEEDNEKYLILVQFFDSIGAHYVKLLAINLLNAYSWHIIQSHEIPNHFKEILSTSFSSDLLTVTFNHGNSFSLSLHNPKMVHVLHSSDKNIKTFAQNGHVIQLNDEYMRVKTVYEYCLEHG